MLGLGLIVAVAVSFLTLPIVAMLLRVPFTDLADYATRPIVRDALLLSLFTSLCSLLLMLIFGTPLAYLLARHRFPGKRLLETLVEIPLVMPPAVAGIALLLAFGRRGLLGPLLEDAGLDIAFSTAAVILAQTFVASPFYIGARASRAYPPILRLRLPRMVRAVGRASSTYSYPWPSPAYSAA
jgi:molybdate transport system permease protein